MQKTISPQDTSIQLSASNVGEYSKKPIAAKLGLPDWENVQPSGNFERVLTGHFPVY